METKEIIDEKGRKYKAMVDESTAEKLSIIIGPPEGLVDSLGLPEPFATRLHNILYNRGIFTYKEASFQNNARGALQDAFSIDVQKLVEAFFNFEKETV